MTFWNFKSTMRLQVLSYHLHTGQTFLEQMQLAGIPFSVCKSEKALIQEMQKDMPLLMLEPAYGEAYTKEFELLLNDKDSPVFILSSDPRWKEVGQKNICYYLPADTHPLELSRLLVEKLNLPAVSNKPSYAFSFFQF